MNNVDIWTIDLDLAQFDLAHAFACLDQREQARAQRYVFEHIRQRFIMSHYALRDILGGYLNCDAAAVSFELGEQQKPSLAAEHHSKLEFNLSHSQDVALVAIAAEQAVGIDVEYHAKDIDYLALTRRFFADEEIAEIIGLPAEQQQQAFFNCWTRKEAFIKAIGQGLHYSLKKFAVNATSGQPAHVVRVEPTLQQGDVWTLCGFEPRPQYTAALACVGGVAQLQYFDYHSA